MNVTRNFSPFKLFKQATGAVAVAGIALGCLHASLAQAQSQAVQQPAKTTAVTPATSPKNNTSSNNWNALTESQKIALAPLKNVWVNVSPVKKQKWLDISVGYHLLSPEGQATLHFRMKEWASLTTKQREQARRNFAQTKKLSPDDKQAQWQAYQALSPAEKQKLAAANQASKPVGVAPAVKPSPSTDVKTSDRPKALLQSR